MNSGNALQADEISIPWSAFHYCRWLDVPPSKTSAGVPENGPTGGQRKFSVILVGLDLYSLLTFLEVRHTDDL